MKMLQEYKHRIDPKELRRNILLKGVNIENLVGREFKIGGVVCYGRKLWPPCKYIVELSSKKDAFPHIGRHCGIRANVTQSGVIEVGDTV